MATSTLSVIPLPQLSACQACLCKQPGKKTRWHDLNCINDAGQALFSDTSRLKAVAFAFAPTPGRGLQGERAYEVRIGRTNLNGSVAFLLTTPSPRVTSRASFVSFHSHIRVPVPTRSLLYISITMYYPFALLLSFLPAVQVHATKTKNHDTTIIKRDAQCHTLYERAAEPTQYAILAEPIASYIFSVDTPDSRMDATSTARELRCTNTHVTRPTVTVVIPSAVQSTLIKVATSESVTDSYNNQSSTSDPTATDLTKTDLVTALVVPSTEGVLTRVRMLFSIWQG
ncbi:hypothetical protein DOTSEDRAFT_39155 [Dothistroma septosporum NZE10]|uniref:Uncharacterized protein n=1 Tax=Dothistroma septosporum (strain NZE10 / CBS 128990) TaxID=675120 RepID=M2XHN8_DOTSN|nr:hypothetical protein DOTSEDRAFT_39155 [Dothistroma septosporum NZE10]